MKRNYNMRNKQDPRKDRTKELSLLSSYHSIDTVVLDKRLRGSGKNYIKLTLDIGSEPLSSEELNTFAKILLEKKSKDNSYLKEELVFMPPDILHYVNTQGLPMYVLEFKENGLYHYEFETHITTLTVANKMNNIKLNKAQII